MNPAIFAVLLAGLLLTHTPARAAMTQNDLLFYGTESLDRGRFEQGVAAFAEVLARDPENPYARGRLALALAGSGQTDKARTALEAAVAARGDDLFALWTLGCLDLREGRPVEAAGRFAAMTKADPDNVRGALGLGLAALASGRRDEGIRQLAAVQEAESQDGLVRYLAGLAWWSLDAPANARLELEATLEIEPRHTAALELLGLVYRRLGQGSLAKSAWEQALAVDQNTGRARFFLSRLAGDEGLAAALADRPEEARRAYERALSIDPDNTAAAKALGLPVPGPGRPPEGDGLRRAGAEPLPEAGKRPSDPAPAKAKPAKKPVRKAAPPNPPTPGPEQPSGGGAAGSAAP